MRIRAALAVTAALAAAVSTPAAIPDPVGTDSGRVSGVTPAVRGARSGDSVRGAPVRELRWSRRRRSAAVDGVRRAEVFGNVCVQPSQRNRVPNNVRSIAGFAADQRGLPVS
jgi:hypothetical protein